MTSQELLGKTVVVIGGSAGIGLETARRARAEGADVILTARNRARLDGARSAAVFDAFDLAALEEFFGRLDASVDHVMVTAGRPYYSPLVEMDFDEARRGLHENLMVMLAVARYVEDLVRPGGTRVFMGAPAAFVRVSAWASSARQRPRSRP
jgi:NAD(P)-dependent dehydrogenase (short-subunit alcohol dehydrogenase family)